MPLDLTGSTFTKKPKQPSPGAAATGEKTAPQTGDIPAWSVTSPRYSLDDLILDEAVRNSLLDAISFYTYKDKVMYEWGLSERYNGRINLSINLYGDSGTGKTMAAHAIAHELGKKILFVDYAEIESKYVGETAKNIKQLFLDAERLDAIIIFDEADALLSKRVTDMRSSSDVSVNQTRSVLLNILNDYTGIVVFTTNFIQNFDPAFIRRIRYQIKFGLPNEELRTQLWRMYIPAQMPTDADIAALAARFDEVSGSDISNAVFSAAIKAARRGAEIVLQTDFEEALSQIQQAKRDNAGGSTTVEKRIVSEEYVKKQLGNQFPADGSDA